MASPVASSTKLQTLGTFDDEPNVVRHRCIAESCWKQVLIKALRQAKGVKKRSRNRRGCIGGRRWCLGLTHGRFRYEDAGTKLWTYHEVNWCTACSETQRFVARITIDMSCYACHRICKNNRNNSATWWKKMNESPFSLHCKLNKHDIT